LFDLLGLVEAETLVAFGCVGKHALELGIRFELPAGFQSATVGGAYFVNDAGEG
jgi:hypothetical protein